MKRKSNNPKGFTLQQRFDKLVANLDAANCAPYSNETADEVMRAFYDARDALYRFVWMHSKEITVQRQKREGNKS